MKYPYWLVFLIGFDRLGAAVVFNCPDMCISSLCWIALNRNRITANAAARKLNFYRWQWAVLMRIGRVLEFIKPGHCAMSANTDIATAARTTDLLQ